MSVRHSQIICGIGEVHGIAGWVTELLMIVLSVRVPRHRVSIEVRRVSAARSRRQRRLLLFTFLLTLLIVTHNHGILVVVVMQMTAPGPVVLSPTGAIET